MSMTLEEWVNKNAYDLLENFKTNADIYCDAMSEENRQDLIRMNLIMVRQWAENGFRRTY